jgi:ADP-heptose:LPS heptosyltransferase
MDIPFADGLLYHWTHLIATRDPVRPLATLDKSKVRSVLLALTTGLGDAVLSTPVFAAVRRALPQAKITLLVRAAWAPLFAAETDIDAVVPYHGKWRRFFPTLRRLRDAAPDLALILHGNDPDILPLAYLAGARHIVRVPTTGTRYGWLLSNVGREADSKTIPGWHYIDNRLRILDSVGIARTRLSPVIRPEPAAGRRAAEWRHRMLGDAAYWVLHPWAADSYKTWPAPQVAELIGAATTRWPQLRIVLTGSTRERNAAEALAVRHAGVVIAAGEFDIAGTAALLTGARAVVAPDTGLLHLAAALDVPTIGLYAPTLVALVGPRAEHAPVRALQQPLTCTPCLEKRCPYAEALCMAQFRSDQVIGALAEILGE